jgi:hypothetical protein
LARLDLTRERHQARLGLARLGDDDLLARAARSTSRESKVLASYRLTIASAIAAVGTETSCAVTTQAATSTVSAPAWASASFCVNSASVGALAK